MELDQAGLASPGDLDTVQFRWDNCQKSNHVRREGEIEWHPFKSRTLCSNAPLEQREALFP